MHFRPGGVVVVRLLEPMKGRRGGELKIEDTCRGKGQGQRTFVDCERTLPIFTTYELLDFMISELCTCVSIS